MRQGFAIYPQVAIAVVGVALLASTFLPILGTTSAALLLLLPVLFAATRGGLGPGLFAAVAGAVAYNYFFLMPRFSFAVNGLDNIVSVFVLAAVAVVTSRLATRLKAREAEAQARAHASEEIAELSALLASGSPRQALATGIAALQTRLGPVEIIKSGKLPQGDARFSSIDLSAAAWSMHNGDITGHGTTVMPAAEWTFLPLAPRHEAEGDLAAIACPSNGRLRSEVELAHLAELARLLGQGWDRAALEQARVDAERLEDTDRLRRTFLASLAHDFRTPLTVIAGQLETLARKSPEAAEALLSARQLDHTMSDLLAAVRLDEGSLHPAMESLDLVDVVGAACNAMTLPTGIALNRNIAADLPFIRGDPVLLHHMLINLIDNAGRHARTLVSITAGVAGDRVMLEFRDDGPGVPAELGNRIFDRFVRIEGGDRTGGSGLGLAIVKGFADAMQMTVSLADAPDGGACFVLSLPKVGTPPT